jgi:cell division septation protein DedD
VRPIPSSPAVPAREMPAAAPIGLYTIQIAALTDAGNARAIVKELTRLGFAAYLLEPAPDGADTLYRVRVGRYASRVSAQRTVTKLEGILGLKLWITRAR